MLKKLECFLAGLPMTMVAGAFLLLDLIPHLTEEFGGTPIRLSFLPFDPAWVTIIISGIPLLYLAIWRMIHNPGISKISSALLICIAMFAAIAIGDLFVNALLDCHDLALSCCREIARISVMEWSL